MLSGAPRFHINAKGKDAGKKECKRTHRNPSGNTKAVGSQISDSRKDGRKRRKLVNGATSNSGISHASLAHV